MQVAIESTEFKGYYVPRGNKDVVISRGYVVINCKTGAVLANIVRNHGYLSVNVNYRVNGKRVEKQYLIHRLYALAFMEIPAELGHLPLSKVQVNHIDGDKLNNHPDNLEWMRAKFNMRHAFENKLIDIATVVLAKHVQTGEIVEFPSVISCALNFDMDYKKLQRHLLDRHEGMITKDWHVFKRKDGRPWPSLTTVDMVKSKWEYTVAVIARHENGTSAIFNSIKEACGSIGLKYESVKNHRRWWFSKGVVDNRFEGWLFEEYDSVVGIDVKGLVPKLKKKRYADKVFLVKNTLTGITCEIIGITALCKAIDYATGTVSNCLRNREFKLGDYEIIIISSNDAPS